MICIMSDNNYIVYAGTLPANDFDGNYIKYKAFTDLTDHIINVNHGLVRQFSSVIMKVHTILLLLMFNYLN